MARFDEAMKALWDGRVIYRKAWDGTKLNLERDTTNIKEFPDAEYYISATLWNGRVVRWINLPDDLTATDWMIE